MAESRRDEIAKLEALFSENPEGRVFTHLAEAYRRAGEPERAREILERGIGRHPEYASAHVVLGRVLVDLGRTEEADRSFRRVLELDPQNLVAVRALADLARDAGRVDDALRYYRELQEVDGGNAELDEIVRSLEAGPAEPDREAAAPYDGHATEWDAEFAPFDPDPGMSPANALEDADVGADESWGADGEAIGGWGPDPAGVAGDSTDAAPEPAGAENGVAGDEPEAGFDGGSEPVSEPAIEMDGAAWADTIETGDEWGAEPEGFEPTVLAGPPPGEGMDDLLEMSIDGEPEIESIDAVGSWDLSGMDMVDADAEDAATEADDPMSFDLTGFGAGGAAAASSETDPSDAAGPGPDGHEFEAPESEGFGDEWAAAGVGYGGSDEVDPDSPEPGPAAYMEGEDVAGESALDEPADEAWGVDEPGAEQVEAAGVAAGEWEAGEPEVDERETDDSALEVQAAEEPWAVGAADASASEPWVDAAQEAPDPWGEDESGEEDPWGEAEPGDEDAWSGAMPEAELAEPMSEIEEPAVSTAEADATEPWADTAPEASDPWGESETGEEDPWGSPMPGAEPAEPASAAEELAAGEVASELEAEAGAYGAADAGVIEEEESAEPVGADAGLIEDSDPGALGVGAVDEPAGGVEAEASDLLDPFGEPAAIEDEDAYGGEVVTETLAELYLAQGLNERAVEVYEELLRRRPGDPGLEERLREALAGAGHVQDAEPVAGEQTGDSTEAGEDESALESVESVWTGGSGAVAGEDALYGLDDSSEGVTEPEAAPVSEYLRTLLEWRPARAAVDAQAAPVEEAAAMDDVDALFASRGDPSGGGAGSGPAAASDAGGAVQSESDESSDSDDDDDLEMFRAWLQSLKR